MRACHQPSGLIGREREMVRFRSGIRVRESLLIWGPRGAGKSALLREAIAESAHGASDRYLYVDGANGRKEILRKLFGQLYAARDGWVLSKMEYDGADEGAFRGWLAKQSSLRLRGIAARAMQETRYWLFLDHLPPASRAISRLLQHLIRACGTPVYMAARGTTAKEIGEAWSIYWNPEHWLELGGLSESAAHQLLNSCWKANGLSPLDLEESRNEILRLSQRLPGAIWAMCALARQPRFRAGRRIKMSLLYTEYLIGTEPLPRKASRANSAARRCQ
jgi:hypothetical protein